LTISDRFAARARLQNSTRSRKWAQVVGLPSARARFIWQRYPESGSESHGAAFPGQRVFRLHCPAT
jgi:hypothetical protein